MGSPMREDTYNMSVCDIVEVDNSEMRKKVTELMAAEGLSSNLRTVIIEPFPQTPIVEDEIKSICQAFGDLESQEVTATSATVTFRSTVSAYLCKEALDELEVRELGIVLRVTWDLRQKTFPLVFFPKVEETLFPLQDEGEEDSKTPINPPKLTKYRCKFPIAVPEEDEFLTSRKLIGAKGCNLRRIIEKCCAGVQLPEKPQHLLSLKLLREPNLTLEITSRYLDKYRQAVNLTEDLVLALYDEYKRHCVEVGRVPPTLELRKRERIVGLRKGFVQGEEFRAHTRATAS